MEPGGLSKDHSKKIRILLDFGEHARELVSSETGLRLLRILAEGDEAVRRVTGDFSNQVLNLLPHTVFKVRATGWEPRMGSDDELHSGLGKRTLCECGAPHQVEGRLQ